MLAVDEELVEFVIHLHVPKDIFPKCFNAPGDLWLEN